VRLIPEPTVGAVKGSRVEIARKNPLVLIQTMGFEAAMALR